MEAKRILFSNHANKRMKEPRQDGVRIEDVHAACHLAKEILIKNVPKEFELKGFISEEGYRFDIVVVDSVIYTGEKVLLIVTVIGQRYRERKCRYTNYRGYALPDLPYKKRKRVLRKLKKKERNWI